MNNIYIYLLKLDIVPIARREGGVGCLALALGSRYVVLSSTKRVVLGCLIGRGLPLEDTFAAVAGFSGPGDGRHPR